MACLSKTAKLIRSLRDDERVMSQKTGTCKWLRVHDESEWSLMTSLIRRFWFPFEQAAGRSLRKCTDHGRLAWTKCFCSRRNPDEAMFHDGNFDQSVASRLYFVGWRMHHACALSKTGVLRNPQTSAQLSGMDPGPNNGVGPGGVSKTQSEKASSIVLMLFLLRHRHAVPLESPATKSTS